MIKCNNCNKIFEDDQVRTESDTFEMFGYHKYYYDVCPYCGDSDLEYDYKEDGGEDEE